MDHRMTVRAEEHQIVEGRSDFAGNMQGNHMMYVGVASAEFAVRILEIEPAGLTIDRTALPA